MATNTISDYHCEAWLAEDSESEDDPQSACPVFLIEIYADVNSITFRKQLLVPQDRLVHNSTSWSTISSKLSEMNVPLYAHSRIIFEIMECARSTVSEDHNIKRNTIPMVVTVKAVQQLYQDQEQEISATLMESINSHVLRFVGATKSSIEALEKVKVEGLSMQCVICLDEILIGSEASRMPCSHVYHPDCIVNWLEKSNICPLCRFQMPTCELDCSYEIRA